MGLGPDKTLFSIANLAQAKDLRQSGRPNIMQKKCMLIRQTDYFLSKKIRLAKIPAKRISLPQCHFAGTPP
jgi:hypothetical protein